VEQSLHYLAANAGGMKLVSGVQLPREDILLNCRYYRARPQRQWSLQRCSGWSCESSNHHRSFYHTDCRGQP